nr:hypothetical protein CFP56_26090 [Quercus suber]
MCAQPVDEVPVRWNLSNPQRPPGHSCALLAPLSIPAQAAVAMHAAAGEEVQCSFLEKCNLDGGSSSTYGRKVTCCCSVGRQLDVISHNVSAEPAVRCRWPDVDVIATTIITKSPNADRNGLPAAKRSDAKGHSRVHPDPAGHELFLGRSTTLPYRADRLGWRRAELGAAPRQLAVGSGSTFAPSKPKSSPAPPAKACSDCDKGASPARHASYMKETRIHPDQHHARQRIEGLRLVMLSTHGVMEKDYVGGARTNKGGRIPATTTCKQVINITNAM